MKSLFDPRSRWHTVWHGSDIVVTRNDAEVDRVHGPDIRRVVFVQPAQATSACELNVTLVELADEFVVFPADTGFAGRVHFERQSFWAAKSCVYWVDAAGVRLPPGCLARRGFVLARRLPCYGRVPRADMLPLLERWVLEGPQSWEERRWSRIQRAWAFARFDTPMPVFQASTRLSR